MISSRGDFVPIKYYENLNRYIGIFRFFNYTVKNIKFYTYCTLSSKEYFSRVNNNFLTHNIYYCSVNIEKFLPSSINK
jgi:hypothetical protein